MKIRCITTWVYLVSLGLGGNGEGDPGGGGVGADGLGVQVPPHLVLPRARQTDALAHLRPLHLLGETAPNHTHISTSSIFIYIYVYMCYILNMYYILNTVQV